MFVITKGNGKSNDSIFTLSRPVARDYNISCQCWIEHISTAVNPENYTICFQNLEANAQFELLWVMMCYWKNLCQKSILIFCEPYNMDQSKSNSTCSHTDSFSVLYILSLTQVRPNYVMFVRSINWQHSWEPNTSNEYHMPFSLSSVYCTCRTIYMRNHVKKESVCPGLKTDLAMPPYSSGCLNIKGELQWFSTIVPCMWGTCRSQFKKITLKINPIFWLLVPTG